MSHIEKRANLWYATLTVPPDVRPVLGKKKFLQSTKTDRKVEAQGRAAVLVAGWKAEITRARGKLPNTKDTFWESLRKQHLTADEDTQLVIEDLAKTMASKSSSPELSSELYKLATNQSGLPLAPLVEDWKKAQKGGQKTIDQKHRDLVRMADHFISQAALKPQRIKAWTEKLLGEGVTYSSFIRIGGACRSFWAYLQDSSAIPMETPDPFVGSFKLALKAAVRTTTGRSGNPFTAEELTGLYDEAMQEKDKSLAHLIALGAYTGARVEELGRLTKENCKDGAFIIDKSKTNAGVRHVPIHPSVAPLVTRMLAASKDGYLVPSTSDNQYGLRMAALGQKFTRLKTKLGYGPDHVFHNTRSTLITLMQQAGVPETVATDVVGHDKGTMTYGLYSGGSSMKQKLQAISKVTYPGSLGRP